MHSVVFGIKRAFLSSTTFLRRTLRAHYGLTQARVDILYLAHIGVTRQSDVCKHLALSRATISETLQILEKLGFVWRRVDSFDRRQRIIEFTEKGLERIKDVVEDWVLHRAGLRMVRNIFEWKRDPDLAFRDIDVFEGRVLQIERWFAPTMAQNPYPDFDPDD